MSWRLVKIISLVFCSSLLETIRMIEGIDSVFGESGYNTFLQFSGGDHEKELEICKNAVENKHLGIIVFPGNEKANAGFYTNLVTEGYPIVFMDRKPNDLPADFVLGNNFLGSMRLCELLIRNGHRRIAYLGIELSGIEERINGYLYALKKYNIPIRPDYIIKELTDIRRLDSSPESTYRIVQRLMNMKEPPTAFMGCNDICAVFIMQKLRKMGFRIPEDISVCGYDNASYATTVTTVDQNFFKMGKTAAKLLLDKLEKKSDNVYSVRISPQVIKRDSVAACPVTKSPND